MVNSMGWSSWLLQRIWFQNALQQWCLTYSICVQCFLKLYSKRVPKCSDNLDVSGRGHQITRTAPTTLTLTLPLWLSLFPPLMVTIIPNFLVYKIFSLLKKRKSHLCYSKKWGSIWKTGKWCWDLGRRKALIFLNNLYHNRANRKMLLKILRSSLTFWEKGCFIVSCIQSRPRKQ